jgi:hypothetical protein
MYDAFDPLTGEPLDPEALYGGFGGADSEFGVPGSVLTQGTLPPTSQGSPKILEQLDQAELNKIRSETHKPVMVGGQPTYPGGTFGNLNRVGKALLALKFITPLIQGFGAMQGGPQRTKRGRFWSGVAAGGLGTAGQLATQGISEREQAEPGAARRLTAEARWQQANRQYGGNAPVTIAGLHGPEIITRDELSRRQRQGPVAGYQRPVAPTVPNPQTVDVGGKPTLANWDPNINALVPMQVETPPQPELNPPQSLPAFWLPQAMNPAAAGELTHPSVPQRIPATVYKAPQPRLENLQQVYANAATPEERVRVLGMMRDEARAKHVESTPKAPGGTRAQLAAAGRRRSEEFRKIKEAFQWDERYGAFRDKNRTLLTPEEYRNRIQDVQNASEQEIVDLGGSPNHHEWSLTEAIAGRIPAPGAAGPVSAAPSGLPPKAARTLKEGTETKFRNGQVWTLKDGQPVRVK